MSQTSYIPFHVPSIGNEEIREVEATLRSGWLTTGPRTRQFEEDLGAYVQAPHAVAVNSATAGLHLALLALGVGPGDEVITTPVTFCSTVHTILHVGATPVLADVGPDGNIDPGELAKKINSRTRAIVPVHLAGLPCDMDAIWDLANRHGSRVIEDAAHAIGAHYDGLPIGAAKPYSLRASDAVVFSFYATKNLTTGEGGMVTTGQESAAKLMQILSLHGISQDAWKRYMRHGSWYYEVMACGFKYNLSDIQSAIGIHQLRKLESFIETRTGYAAIYNEMLGGMDELELPPDSPRCRHAWHLYMPRLNLDRLRINRDEFIQKLSEREIGTSLHFIPIPLHPYFARLPLARGAYPRALDLYARIVSLPLYPAMSEDQVRHVAACVREVLEGASKTKVFAAAAGQACGVGVCLRERVSAAASLED